MKTNVGQQPTANARQIARSRMARTLFILIAVLCAFDAPCATPQIVGGYTKASVTSKEVVAAAQFAVAAQAKATQPSKDQQHITLKLIRVLAAESQVVAGTNYRLTLRVSENGKRKTSIATVWWQPWRTPNPYELTSWEWKASRQ